MLIRNRTITLLLAASLVTLLTAGCVERNIENISAEEAAALPAPPPPQAPAATPQAAAPQAPSTRITGVIEIAPEHTGPVPAGATLYLIVRVAGRATGAPLAVQQVPAPTFPFEFEITERDAMIENTPLVGDLSITARLDQDGDAFSTTAGDLSGEVSPVVAGDSGVVIRLQEVSSGDVGS
jgi:hypothetical protein